MGFFSYDQIAGHGHSVRALVDFSWLHLALRRPVFSSARGGGSAVFFFPPMFALRTRRADDEVTDVSSPYGYRGKDSRANLYSLPTGEICYYVASLAVLYNPESQTQRHLRMIGNGHREASSNTLRRRPGKLADRMPGEDAV